MSLTLPICIEIPEIPNPLAITLPGGITMQQIDLMQAIQPALTPLAPLFDVVDAIVAVFNCVKAIPDALGPPPDPTVLAACIPDLAKKVGKLLKLIPQLSLPLTIIGVIDLVLDTLQSARSQLVHLQSQALQVASVVERATQLGDAGLMAIARCARTNVEQESRNVGKSLASLGKLMGILNLFLGMVGGPTVPDLSNLSGLPLEQIIAPIDALIQVLRTVRRAVPVP